VELTSHLHLVSRTRESVAIPSLPYTFYDVVLMHQAQLFVYFEMVFKAPSPCEEEQDCKRRSNFISLVCAHLIVIYLFVFYLTTLFQQLGLYSVELMVDTWMMNWQGF